MKKTLIIGASEKPERFSNKAIAMLKEFDYEVVAIGIKDGTAHNTRITREKPEIENLHTISLYINANQQVSYYEYIISLKPNRIIFNPGTENIELEKIAKNHGIQIVYDCTLVMLVTGQF